MSNTGDFIQKNSFIQNFDKMKLSPNIVNLTPVDSEMLYIMFLHAIILRKIVFLNILRNRVFSQKRQYPPLENFSEL
jgi:hypothetical protein